MGTASSSSSGSASASRSAARSPASAPVPVRSPYARVKPEPVSPPRARSWGLVIRERRAPNATSSPPCRRLCLVTPKTEPGTSSSRRKPKKEKAWSPPPEYVEKALALGSEDDPDGFVGFGTVAQLSANTLQPTELERALAWSKEDHERTERARQESLLERARRHRATNVVIIESSSDDYFNFDDDDDVVGPSSAGHWGDPGQGCSSAAPKAPSDDDGGDYSQDIYRSPGMGPF